MKGFRRYPAPRPSELRRTCAVADDCTRRADRTIWNANGIWESCGPCADKAIDMGLAELLRLPGGAHPDYR